MSDYCYSHVYCMASDSKTFVDMGYREEGGAVEDEVADDCVEMIDEQANYGNYDELRKLRGVVFIARNETGGEYGPCEIVSDGERTSSADVDHDGNNFVVMEGDGTIDPEKAEMIRGHLALYHKVRGMLRLDKEPKVTAKRAMPDTLKDWMSKIDPELFRKQRSFLISLPMKLVKQKMLTRPQAGLLEGLINLTDNMADYIADELGRKEVLLTEAKPKCRK